MSKLTLTRRDLAQRALLGAAGALLAVAAPAQAQVVDPDPAVPPPLPVSTAPKATGEGELLAQLVPINVGYTLTDTQAKEVARQIGDYPGSFAKARAYVLPDDVGPSFSADAPFRKERVK